MSILGRALARQMTLLDDVGQGPTYIIKRKE